jgi:hypothetical protein
MIRICSLLRDAAFELMKAMEQLQDHKAVAAEHAQRAKALENRGKRFTVKRCDMFIETDDVHTLVKYSQIA